MASLFIGRFGVDGTAAADRGPGLRGVPLPREQRPRFPPPTEEPCEHHGGDYGDISSEEE
jgi:hypothetical protein